MSDRPGARETTRPEFDFGRAQGLVFTGFGHLPSASYHFFELVEPVRGREALVALFPSVTWGLSPEERRRASTPDRALQLAFTAPGLRALGVDPDRAVGFDVAFLEGMIASHRRRKLGDVDAPSFPSRSPESWQWGGPLGDASATSLHLLVLSYAIDDAELARMQTEIEGRLAGWRPLQVLGTRLLGEEKGHFGFRDGLSQPVIRDTIVAGDKSGVAERDRVAAGEFLLGFDREGGGRWPVPSIDGTEFGLGGSYLVFRQLAQDVPGFWSAVEAAARDLNDPELDAVTLASKMVGRRPDGSLLDGRGAHEDFDFSDDPEGRVCPIGSHIRRSNPRAGLTDDPVDSITEVKRRRLLRRGRTFGSPAPSSVYPAGLGVTDRAGSGPPGDARGIHFIALNASLEQQFEFVQQSWVNSRLFGGRAGESDPISGLPGGGFHVPAEPWRARVPSPADSVRVLGGGYFFLPGRAALEYFARVWTGAP